ncbi:MAG: DUF4116 domain-containing protein [Pseudomonadota bacterium]|nr:DUF4116 domain-containing protein [Pseudomonadota bacterium]
MKQQNEEKAPYSREEPTTLTHLANETILHIFQFLSFRSWCVLSSTCKRIHEITKDSALWSRYYPTTLQSDVAWQEQRLYIHARQDYLAISRPIAHKENLFFKILGDIHRSESGATCFTTLYKYHSEFGPEIIDNKDIVREVVKKYGCLLEVVSCRLKNDKATVLLAVKNNPCALQHASDDLKADQDVVLAAVTKSGRTLQFASDELRANKNIVLAAVARSDQALQYASEELRADEDILAASADGRPSGILVWSNADWL